ncbi:MAG: hypothetical protein KC766_34965 [Myxococcales bacterium]|nr:hypothetical protein [Myxococcales bacterium]
MNAATKDRLAAAAAVVLFVGIALGFWLWQRTGEARALHDLAPAQRQVVLERELAAYARLCPGPLDDEALEARCEDKARFISQFPECGSQCERIIKHSLPRPER